MVIVDSSVWVDYLRGASTPQVEWLDHRLPVQPLAITDIILCEVLQGIRDDVKFVKTRDELLKLHLFSNGGQAIALAAAANYRTLRARGRTVKTIDCLIATFCVLNGHSLLHNDRDYDVFVKELGLAVVQP
jgi:predicted nucleic acid-binding protein